MRKRQIIFGILFLIISTEIVFVFCDQPSKSQEILLNFYTQELLTHGAMLFAATTASFRFITGLIDKTDKLRGKVTFVLLSGMLLVTAIFIGARIIHYGALTQGVIVFEPEEEYSFAEYQRRVSNHTIDIYEKNHWIIGNLVKTMDHGLYDLNPFSPLPISIYIGLFLAYLILFSFGRSQIERPWFWFGLLLVPAFIGISGALSYWRTKITTNCFLTIAWVSILLWYLVLPLYVTRDKIQGYFLNKSPAGPPYYKGLIILIRKIIELLIDGLCLTRALKALKSMKIAY